MSNLIAAHCAAQWVQILDILQEAGLGDDFTLRMCEELLMPSGSSPVTDDRTEDKKARDVEYCGIWSSPLLTEVHVLESSQVQSSRKKMQGFWKQILSRACAIRVGCKRVADRRKSVRHPERGLTSPGLQPWLACCAGAVQIHSDVGGSPRAAAGSDREGAGGVHQYCYQPRSSPSKGFSSLPALLRLPCDLAARVFMAVTGPGL